MNSYTRAQCRKAGFEDELWEGKECGCSRASSEKRHSIFSAMPYSRKGRNYYFQGRAAAAKIKAKGDNSLAMDRAYAYCRGSCIMPVEGI